MNGDTKKEDLQPPPSEEDEDDQASTPRAGSRKSSIAGLDSASEVFEDAYDDDDYFDDVPTFEEPQQSNHGAKSPMNVILPALQGLENEDDRDNEIESLGIAENHYHAISTPPATTTTQQQQPVSLSATTTTNIGHESTLDHTATTEDDSSQPIKEETTQPAKKVTKETTQPDNEVTKETAQPVKESNNEEAAQHVKEITKEATTSQVDKEVTHDDQKEEESWKSDPNAMSMDGFMQEVQEAELAFRDDGKEQRSTDAPIMSATNAPYYNNNDIIEKEHHVEKSTVDVLQDLEDLDTKREDRPESIELAPAPRGDTDSPVTDNGLFDTKTSDEVSQPTRNTSIADDDDVDGHHGSNNNNKKEKEEDHLGAILPVMEDSAREIIGEQPTDMDRAAARSLEYEHPVEDPIDLDMFRDNVISIPTIDPKCVPINTLTPRDQEEAGMYIYTRCGMD